MPKELPKPEALSHVLYEMWMMLECYSRFPLVPIKDRTLKNMHLEGFIVHARCLDEFFSKPKESSNSDNLTPKYFGFLESPKLYKRPIDVKRMNKEVAHLTHSRKFASPNTEWNLGKELSMLRAVCIAFLKHVQSDPALMAYANSSVTCAHLIADFTRSKPVGTKQNSYDYPLYPVSGTSSPSGSVMSM